MWIMSWRWSRTSITLFSITSGTFCKSLISLAFPNTCNISRYAVHDPVRKPLGTGASGSKQINANSGSSLFPMDKMIFNSSRVGFCEDNHTKQRRAQIPLCLQEHYSTQMVEKDCLHHVRNVLEYAPKVQKLGC